MFGFAQVIVRFLFFFTVTMAMLAHAVFGDKIWFRSAPEKAPPRYPHPNPAGSSAGRRTAARSPDQVRESRLRTLRPPHCLSRASRHSRPSCSTPALPPVLTEAERPHPHSSQPPRTSRLPRPVTTWPVTTGIPLTSSGVPSLPGHAARSGRPMLSAPLSPAAWLVRLNKPCPSPMTRTGHCGRCHHPP